MTSKVTFMQQDDEYHTESMDVIPNHSVTISFDSTDVTLNDMIDQFELFLKAIGYTFKNKHLGLIEDYPVHTDSMRIDDYEKVPRTKTEYSPF